MSKVPGFKEWAATKDAPPVSMGVDMDKWDAEFYDDDGSTLFRSALEDMAREIGWHGSVERRTGGYDVGGTHDDGSEERLARTKSIPLWDADLKDEGEREQAEGEVRDLVKKWLKKRGWAIEPELT